MNVKMALTVLLLCLNINGNGPEGWELFDKVVFKPEYFEEAGGYFEVPTFDPDLKALEHSTVTLSGHFIPIEVDTIFVLSAMPFSSCFFCGGAGPETVAEVRIDKIPKDLSLDALVKVEGKLRLNANDINYMNFIIESAKIVE